jgi:two-component system, OmpR family, response regulator AdeR
MLDGIQVLLLDDDKDLLAVMQMILESRGALVVPVSHAEAALAALPTMTADVLVLDITMPRRDGWWLLNEARTRGVLDGVSVLVVTGRHLKREQIEEARLNGYLQKPVDANTLCMTVERLARAGSRRSA